MSSTTSIRDTAPTITQRLRALGLGGRRLKRGWTRQRAVELVKTLGYVLPLTLLVWVWAQDQQIDVDIRQSVPIQINHIDAGKVVSIRGSGTGEPLVRGGAGGAIRVHLTFQGPRIGLSTVARAITDNTISAALEIRLRREAGESPVFLREELNQLPLLRDAGVTVREANPASIIVVVEDRQQIEVRIAADNVGLDDLVGPVEFDP
jgi:hypothetical protein